MGYGEVWAHLLGVFQGVCNRVIIVVHECILNALVIHLGLPAFDATDSGLSSLLSACLLFPSGE